MAKTALRVLPPLEGSLPLPRWGDEFSLCRERSGYSNRTITDALKFVGVKCSTAMISRLEDAEEVPTLLTQRIIATAAMVLYGRDPDLLGLDLNELPGTIYAALVEYLSAGPDGGGDQRIAKSRCTAQASVELATVTPLRFTQPSFDLEEAA